MKMEYFKLTIGNNRGVIIAAEDVAPAYWGRLECTPWLGVLQHRTFESGCCWHGYGFSPGSGGCVPAVNGRIDLECSTGTG